jgi:hypothetical protein
MKYTSGDLRKLRKLTGLSMAECARQTNTPYTTWSKWEVEDENHYNHRPPHPLAIAWVMLYLRAYPPQPKPEKKSRKNKKG